MQRPWKEQEILESKMVDGVRSYRNWAQDGWKSANAASCGFGCRRTETSRVDVVVKDGRKSIDGASSYRNEV
jgi:hypothetical protein